ncbi:cyclic nucleotide-binding domain-containing protein [Tateyamaria omphalii]|uniref:ABC transporter transmembrane domain-containing protein n=1 Tax=Tateyamaria omphalii TaxID=299262 RepID=UPI001C992B88|nr:ABC transporter transmembrane domain-containing protein [Tateyamaria omphalii]MBY5933313.1 cyclic nucleotide-binding domain-containing protein [Tateyamaria omphalii]
MDSTIFAFIWKHSKRDQLMLLGLTIVTFPFLYATLELPKRIINDAIGATDDMMNVFGLELTQIQFLLALCFGYLGAVLAHGLLKMRLNTMKGVTAERLLRRFRFQLISRMLRFPRSYFRSTSQGELVSMVTSEAEPMGGLMGDMVAQPVFQAGQMLIIVVFLFLQSVWFGLAGIALIPLQAWIIPMLQRQINLLNKERIRQIRSFSSEIGESAAGISDLRTNGGLRYRLAQFTDRLSKLFEVRFQIYQKKFFMKFLNNFITQLTPFFFYSVGGVLAIRGDITVGALVAAIAAYKDLSSPWKELLTYYNQTQDMSLRWEIVTDRFAPRDMIDESLFEGEPEVIPHLQGDIVLNDVTVRNAENTPVLERIDLTIPKGARVAIQVKNQTERTALAELLVREVLPTRGSITIAGHDLSTLHQEVVSARIGYAQSRPYLFDGTLGTNLLMPLMTRPNTVPWGQGRKDRYMTEAMRSGNSPDRVDTEWVDPALAGLGTEDEVRAWWFALVEAMGIDEFMFRRMLVSRMDPQQHPELAKAIVALRPIVEERLREQGLQDAVYRFDPEEFNPAVPLGGNLLFAAPSRDISQQGLARDERFINLVFEHGLAEQGIAISQTLIETLHQTFGRDGTSHPLFTALNIEEEMYEQLVDISSRRRDRGDVALTDDEFALLLTVPFAFTAEQIGPAFPESFKNEIVQIRKTSGAALREQTQGFFIPIAPETYLPRLTLVENILYGRISMFAGAKEEVIEDLVADVVKEHDLRRQVAETVFDIRTGLGGTNLPTIFHERAAFSRAGIKRPDILVLDRALASHGSEERRKTREALRELLPESTLIFLEENFNNPDAYDLFVEITDGRIDGVQTHEEDDEEADDLSRKLRVISRADLFSGVTSRNQRLLAFAAQWYTAQPGQRIFSMDEKPDAAYLCVKGSAILSYDGDNGEDRHVSVIEPGRLIGDLAIILNEPRQLHLTALTEVTFLRIGAAEFRAVLEEDATVLRSLLNTVASHLTGAAELLRQANVQIPQDEGPPPPPLDR